MSCCQQCRNFNLLWIIWVLCLLRCICTCLASPLIFPAKILVSLLLAFCKTRRQNVDKKYLLYPSASSYNVVTVMFLYYIYHKKTCAINLICIIMLKTKLMRNVRQVWTLQSLNSWMFVLYDIFLYRHIQMREVNINHVFKGSPIVCCVPVTCLNFTTINPSTPMPEGRAGIARYMYFINNAQVFRGKRAVTNLVGTFEYCDWGNQILLKNCAIVVL